MDTQWEGPHWSVSPHNFAEEIAIPPRPVQLHDVTLRDGEECADLAYSVDAKVRIAEALALLGVRRTELFLTVPGWEAAARAIIARQLPLDIYVTWDPAKTPRLLDWAFATRWSGTGPATYISGTSCNGSAPNCSMRRYPRFVP